MTRIRVLRVETGSWDTEGVAERGLGSRHVVTSSPGVLESSESRLIPSPGTYHTHDGTAWSSMGGGTAWSSMDGGTAWPS